MTEAVERLVNLALFLAAARGPVSAERIRAELAGYPPDQDFEAFIRMFERDKDQLRSMGLVIEATAEGEYRLDTERTFVGSLDLTAEEETALRTTAAVFAADPSFPFGADLRFALAKIAGGTDPDVASAAHLADEDPEGQGAAVARLSAACTARKRVRFDYTNAAGRSAPHDVEPYGLFLHAGRWYLVGRDTTRDDVRVYAVSRMANAAPESARPRTPDFERPDGFDVAAYVGLPFQYGTGERFEAEVRFAPTIAWRARALTGGAGDLRPEGDDLVWRITARDPERLARWVVANGPGISIDAPAEPVELLRAGLAKAVSRHA